MKDVTESDLFNDESLEALAGAVGTKVDRKVEAKSEKTKDEIILLSGSKVPSGFRPMGTGFYKKAHKIWKLEKQGESFMLKRNDVEDPQGGIEIDNAYERLRGK